MVIIAEFSKTPAPKCKLKKNSYAKDPLEWMSLGTEAHNSRDGVSNSFIGEQLL